MPIVIDGKSYQWSQFGKPLNLNTLSVQEIDVTIEFPHKQNSNGNLDCDPVTVNLLKDIGISPNSKVYCVKWGDNKPETDTISNGFIVYHHKHTYDGPKGTSSYTKTFTITIYGDQLLPFRGNVKQVGTPPNGFKITSVERSLTPKRARFIGFGSGISDSAIYNGARIVKGLLGKDVFYHRDIQGTAVVYEIVVSGANEVRLVNPLVKGNNNWENRRTDVSIDWGDGSRTLWYNKKINSGLFNTASKVIPAHTYKANKGDRFTVTVESIEPLVPIGCTILSIDGTFPEDCYTDTNLFTYTEAELNDKVFRKELTKHKNTITYLGGGLLDNWINVNHMEAKFLGWSALATLGEGFFGPNILSVVKTYTRCFSECRSLKNVPEYLLGETNNVVTNTREMFRYSKVESSIKLKVAKKLTDAQGMYSDTKVNSIVDFLEDAPELQNVSYIFYKTNAKDYTNKFLSTSANIRTAGFMFQYSKIENILINMKQWANIVSLEYSYANCPLASIENDIFSGNFGQNSTNNSIKLEGIFSHIGTDSRYTDIKPNVFKPLANICKKLYSYQGKWLQGSKIITLRDGMFDNVFRHWANYDETKATEGRFDLSAMLAELKTKDSFGYEEPCIRVHRMFRNGFGVISVRDLLSKTSIGYIDHMVLQDAPNIESVRSLFAWSKLYTKIPNDIFKGLRKINSMYATFYLTYYKFEDTPLDRILYINGSHELEAFQAFDTDKVRVYRLFNKDSNFTGTIKTNGTDLLHDQSLPQSVIINGVRSDIPNPNKFTIRPLVLYTVATENTTVTLSNGTRADITVDGTKSTVNLPYTLNLSKGNHKIEIVSSTAVVADGYDFYVTAIDGEYPYNSVIPDYPSCYVPREIGQFVYAVCDANSVHSKNRLSYSPILHKNIFNYHDKVTSSKYFDIGDNCIKGCYGLQPRIYHHMYGLTSYDNMFNSSVNVITDIHLPNLTGNKSAVIINENVTDPVSTNIHYTAFSQGGNLTGLNFGRAQICMPVGVNNPAKRKKNEYLEIRIEGSNTPLQLTKLIGDPTFPITVEIVSKGSLKPAKHVLNNFSTTINVTGDYYARIYSDKPVWVNVKDKITELYGVIPPCNFTQRFSDLAPNLRRVGALLLIRCTNTSFANTFRGLSKFEYFPGTLFWYNYNANDYESCFADCPNLFKVDDYIITDKVGDINCRNMFANSGVKNIRRPIADDIMGKVDITGMLIGCVTGYYYGYNNIDAEMFKNVDIYGESGVKFSGTNSVRGADLNTRYVCLDPTKADMDVTYYIPEDLLHNSSTNWNSLKYASQAICGQVFDIDSRDLSPDRHVTRYLPFLIGFDMFAINTNSNIPDDYYSYCEFIKYTDNITFNTAISFPKLALYRNNDVMVLGSYQGSKFTNTNIADTMPFDCGSMIECDTTYTRVTGLTISNGWKIPKHIIRDASKMFASSNIVVPYGMFDDKDISGMSAGRTRINEMFESNKSQITECGVFRSFGPYLHPTAAGVYWKSGLRNLDADTVFAGCEHMEVLDDNFRELPNLSTLPKINHMTKLWSYKHMFERSNIKEIPANYIYTTRSDKDVMIDYMFANCPSLFVLELFVDPRCPGNFSIDYSLNEVFSGLGDDPEIFGHIKYDNAYEHRSRVRSFDDKIAFIQHIETFKSNVTVKLEGLYNSNLVGFKPSGTFAVTWGDSDSVHTVSSGTALTANDITHTYANAGRYEVKIMLNDDCCYVSTIEAKESDVITTELPTSFKFGNINDIKTKGLSNMFGTSVKRVGKDLFTKLEGVNSIGSYPYMFTKFKGLTDLEVGILDCMPNLTDLSYFLYNSSRSNVNITLKKGLLDKLTKLKTIAKFAHGSNVSVIEQGFLDKNIELTTVNAMLWSTKVTEVPRDLLHKLTKLTDISHILGNSTSFVLDNTYNDFFKYNILATTIDKSFVGCKIKAIPANIFKSLRELTSAVSSFSVVEINQWETPDNNMRADLNDIDIPSGLFSDNPKLTTVQGLFSGRISIKSYPQDLLNHCKGYLKSVNSMFNKTGIEVIHQGTFDGHTTNIDARYMFYDCSIRPCPKLIINSTGTFKTKGMLYGVSGLATEAEIFTGVKTDPTDIQSMYRRGFEYYIMDIESNAGNIYVKALEPSSFPWIGYTLDIDYGDNNPIKIKVDVPDQAKLTEITRRAITAGARTVKVEAPYAVELAGTNISYKRLYGEFGELKATTHILFKNTSYKNSRFTIDSDNFYKRNSHITNLNEAFSDTGIEYIRTNALKHLSRVTTMISMCRNAVNFKIKSGYTPVFEHMRLTDVTQAFEGDTSLVVNKDWEPFKNIPTIRKATNVFCRTGIITTPYVNTTSLLDAQGMYWTCSNLTTTYADILNGASKCSNFYGTFGNTPKLTIIEEETDTHSVGDTPITGVSGSIDYHQMFINTGLPQQQVVRIINNLGVWKVDTQLNVNATEMFSNRANVSTSGVKPGIKIRGNNKKVNAVKMFYNAKLMNVPKLAVALSGNSSLEYVNMFYNCFADPSVEILNEVFSIPGQTATTDFRNSELDTLNVFTINVTPKKVEQASVMRISTDDTKTFTTIIEDKVMSAVNVGDSISNVIPDSEVIVVSLSDITITEKLKEE